MNEDWENEELLDINDPSLPDALRDHGKLFRNPARYVIDVGDSGFVLYAEDGELLDIVHVKE
jgi:hypothetical protein